jgi:hypothetical protein
MAYSALSSRRDTAAPPIGEIHRAAERARLGYKQPDGSWKIG